MIVHFLEEVGRRALPERVDFARWKADWESRGHCLHRLLLQPVPVVSEHDGHAHRVPYLGAPGAGIAVLVLAGPLQFPGRGIARGIGLRSVAIAPGSTTLETLPRRAQSTGAGVSSKRRMVSRSARSAMRSKVSADNLFALQTLPLLQCKPPAGRLLQAGGQQRPVVKHSKGRSGSSLATSSRGEAGSGSIVPCFAMC